MGEKPKQWDLVLSRAEFDFNRSQNQCIGFSPSEIVYGQTPNNVLDLTHIPHPRKLSAEAEDMVEDIKAIH